MTAYKFTLISIAASVHNNNRLINQFVLQYQLCAMATCSVIKSWLMKGSAPDYLLMRSKSSTSSSSIACKRLRSGAKRVVEMTREGGGVKSQGGGAAPPPPPPPQSSSSSKVMANFEQQQRRSANYQPSVWADSYIQSLPVHDFLDEDVVSQIMNLKETVKHLLKKENKVVDKLQLIDNLQQLGVSYHFEKEINDILTAIYRTLDSIYKEEIQADLYSTSLLFRLLREHGFHISTDIFNGFKDEKCMFNTNFSSDIKGMLSLYEASFLARDGEHHMEEAKKFAIKVLKYHTGSLIEPTILKEHLTHALEQPLYWRAQRIHTRWFIDMYEREKDMNPSLLKLAKLDFNMVQGVYKSELKELSRWWVNLGIPESLKFARDRLVENYLMVVGWAFEPKYLRTRVAMAKVNSLVTTIDDVYDVYGSLDELELFTGVVERWDANEIEQLPYYMKICFMALFNTTNGTAYEILKLKGVNVIPQLKRAWIDLCKSYLVEARWYHGGYIPTFEEYLDNAWISISGPVVLTHAYCTSELLIKESLECYHAYPKEVYHSSIIFRLCDDLATSTAELERGDVLKSVQCYMNQYKVTEDVAREKIKEMVGSAWKQLNVDFINNYALEKSFKKVALNIPRMAQWMYQYGDGYGEPGGRTREQIISMFINPIKI